MTMTMILIVIVAVTTLIVMMMGSLGTVSLLLAVGSVYLMTIWTTQTTFMTMESLGPIFLLMMIETRNKAKGQIIFHFPVYLAILREFY